MVKLTKAQKALFDDIAWGERTKFNGRARRSLEALRAAGLIEFTTDVRLSANGKSAEVLTVTKVIWPDTCDAELDRGVGNRPRFIHCRLDRCHPGEHSAAWGRSQKWMMQRTWGKEPVGTTPAETVPADRLSDFLATLPEGHPERPGVIRSIEVLRSIWQERLRDLK